MSLRQFCTLKIIYKMCIVSMIFGNDVSIYLCSFIVNNIFFKKKKARYFIKKTYFKVTVCPSG